MRRGIWTAGFAIFTMFFGAGNITLPLLLTQNWTSTWPIVFVGFCLTAVLVTIIGLIAGVLAETTKEFFAPLGLVAGLLMQLVLISIEGPFGIIPRCLIVAFGGIKEILPHTNALYFYSIAAIGLYFLAVNKTRLISILGNYITPIMLILLSTVIGVAFYNYKFSAIESASFAFSYDAFHDGVIKGYLTYDLPGAIYFTTIAMGYLYTISKTKKEMISNGLKACMISSVLLILVYAAFFYLGATYSASVSHLPVEQILSNIVKNSFGHTFAIIFSGFIAIACLTTAVAAVTIWTDFIHNLLPKNKVSYKSILIGSLALSVAISNLNFTGLIKVLTPVLALVYPALLGLAIYNIFTKYRALSASPVLLHEPHLTAQKKSEETEELKELMDA